MKTRTYDGLMPFSLKSYLASGHHADLGDRVWEAGAEALKGLAV